MGYLETANEAAIAAAARRRRPTVEKIELSPRGWGNWDDPGDELRALVHVGLSIPIVMPAMACPGTST